MAIITFLAVAPSAIIMPSSLQMLILGVVLVLITSFLVIFWREKPADEREVSNQAVASRSAYIVGTAVLIIALAWQSLHHRIDPFVAVALFAILATKIIVQSRKDNQ